MKKTFPTYLILICALMLICGNTSLKAQGTNTNFGKNVIQYTDFDWAFYRTDNFDIYYYQGGKELARFLMVNGEQYLKEIETKVDFPLADRMTFVIYNTYTDYRQSNFHSDINVANYGGKSRISDNIAFIYFDGNHFNFIKQVKSGISEILLQELLYGGSLQERLQSDVLLNLPDWYSEGLVRFLSDEWSAKDETILRAEILRGKYRKFHNVSDQQAALIGESIWRYINEKYGPEAVANIIYIMRANKSLEAGYLFVLGKDFAGLYNEWYQYELMRFSGWENHEPQGEVITHLKKVFKKGTVSSIRMSVKGTYAAVVTNDHGLTRLYVVNTETGKKRKIYKKGYRRGGDVFDYNYPLIAWNTRKNELTVIYEDKSRPYYIQYNAEENKKTEPQLIQRVGRILSFDYAEDGHSSIMSVIINGQTDIMSFDFRSQRQRNITNDIYDDLNPRFVRNGKGIVFESNRPETSLEKVNTSNEFTFNDDLDIFYMPDYIAGKKIHRLSNSSANETIPDAYDTAWFSYLTDANGIINRNAVYLDSIFDHISVVIRFKDTSIMPNDTFYFYTKDVSKIILPEKLANDSGLIGIDTAMVYRDTLYTYPQTDYGMNIIDYKINKSTSQMYELFYDKEGYKLYKQPIPTNFPSISKTRIRSNSYQSKEIIKEKKPDYIMSRTDNFPKSDTLSDSTTSTQKDYFQTYFPKPAQSEIIVEDRKRNAFIKNPDGRIRFASANPYDLQFKPDFVITKLDNGITFTPYIPYKTDENYINNPVLNAMFKVGLSDLFKDYRLLGGVRVLASLRGAEYFLRYEDLKHRLDRTTTLYRHGETKDFDSYNTYRQTSTELRQELSWPFSEISAIKLAGFARMDKNTYLAGEKAFLLRPTEVTYWGGMHAEYVFDNTIARGTNFFNGTRAKVYTDLFNAFNKEKMTFAVVGLDARHYSKLFRNLIWANRVAAAGSLGQAKVVYFMGGVDNWLFPHYNQENLVDPNINYVYKSLATPLRGFDQNVRNGSSYTVWNSELRMPLFRFLFNRPFANQFLQNFQLVGFLDAGTAWNGFNAFSIENSYEKRIIQRTPFEITVVNIREPIVYGYGMGVRTILFGYFLKGDFAWGVEDGQKKPRKFYLSIGTDF